MHQIPSQTLTNYLTKYLKKMTKRRNSKRINSRIGEKINSQTKATKFLKKLNDCDFLRYDDYHRDNLMFLNTENNKFRVRKIKRSHSKMSIIVTGVLKNHNPTFIKPNRKTLKSSSYPEKKNELHVVDRK